MQYFWIHNYQNKNHHCTKSIIGIHNWIPTKLNIFLFQTLYLICIATNDHDCHDSALVLF